MRWKRVCGRTILLAMLVSVTALSLSDRILLAPVKAGASTAFDVGRAVEAGAGVDVDGPFASMGHDTIGHFLLWGLVGLVAAFQATRRWNRFQLAVTLFAFSAAVEVAQPLLSWSRAAETTDLAANGAGLAVGFAVVEIARSLTPSGPNGSGPQLVGRPGPGWPRPLPPRSGRRAASWSRPWRR